MNILFAASEAFPMIKTGGLGDVVHSLSEALKDMGDDIRLVLPAYRNLAMSVYDVKELGFLDIVGAGNITHHVRIVEAHEDECGVKLYLVDIPSLFDRPGNPYVQADGSGWHDNAERYTVFSRVVAELATDGVEGDWLPDVVHCHDWQTGLVPAFLSIKEKSPTTIFTIHNLAYDGLFSWDEFNNLGLPAEWWSPDAIEFYGGFSMIKAGMVFSDHVTTVSPTYAQEICTPEFGCRYEGVLQHLGDRLSGILNGIDLNIWNPQTDQHIKQNYHVNYRRIAGKLANKNHLLGISNLPVSDAPLLGFIGRMVEQKGVDLIAAILPQLFEETDAVMVSLGAGDKELEKQFATLANQYPNRLHAYIGYSEDLAHQIEAGCDLFLMPSRFEPCGLNQMYSLRYGTPPLVNFTGGLADTVVDSSPENIDNGTANGFVIHNMDEETLLMNIIRALDVYRKPKIWHQICRTAMENESGWESSARQYRNLYQT